MMIYSNTNGEMISFRYWDGERHVDLNQKVAFVNNAMVGSPMNPQVFTDERDPEDLALPAKDEEDQELEYI